MLELVQRRGDPAEVFGLGKFAFGPILRPRRNYPIEVTVSQGRDGLVQVAAKDPSTGERISHTIEEGSDVQTSVDFETQLQLVDSVRINM